MNVGTGMFSLLTQFHSDLYYAHTVAVWGACTALSACVWQSHVLFWIH